MAKSAHIDECKDWGDKAAALASYAKQADDDTLRNHAKRIQARAVKRCGQLLKQYDGRGGDRSKSASADTSAPTQRDAASDAGMSKRQQVTAIRVANVPDDEFEASTESDDPPTVTALAEMGSQSRTPPGFARGIEPSGSRRLPHHQRVEGAMRLLTSPRNANVPSLRVAPVSILFRGSAEP